MRASSAAGGSSARAAVLIALLGTATAAAAQEPAHAPAADAGALPEGDPGALSAQIDSAVERLVKKAQEDARTLLAAKNYAGALHALENARELDLQNVEIVAQLAELQVLLGQNERAEALYRELIRMDPERGAAYVALGDLLAHDANAPERLEEAGSLFLRARELLGQDSTLILRQARLAALRGKTEEAEHAYQSYLASARADDALRLELGDFYRDAAKPDEAARFYREITGGERARVAAQRLFELEVDREARRYGLAHVNGAADAQARALAAKGRSQRAQGNRDQALSLLREALRVAPGLASAHADLADVLYDQNDAAEAELEYLRAIALDGTQPDVLLRLSELYLNGEPPRASLASVLAQRALSVRPDWTEPQLLLARAYRAQGDLPRALFHVKLYLARAPLGAARDEALALQASLEMLLGGSDTSAAGQDPKNVKNSKRDPLARARAFIARGQSDAALAELARVTAKAASVDAFELEALLLSAAGRFDEAARVLGRSLAAFPGRPQTQEALGRALIALHREHEARPHLLACERAGFAACRFRLAQLDAGADRGLAGVFHDLLASHDLLAARDRLQDLGADRAANVSAAEITSLRASVARRLDNVLALGVLLLLTLAAAFFTFRQLRYGGLDLATLLDRHPDAGAELQALLSAIRHEVLKHNTFMLGGLIEALETGKPAGEPAEHILRALFGREGSTDAGHEGVEPRLFAYTEALTALARARGERLSQRRDPLIAPLFQGFARMRKLAPRLLAADSLGAADRQGLAAELRGVDVLLNQRAHAALRSLLDRMRYLQLDAARLHAIFERVRGEPALAAQAIAPLALDPTSALPCSLLLPERAFDDILSNLFRNALQASVAHTSERPIVIGAHVALESDPITAIEHVLIRVRDRAPAPLDRARLQGAYIEAGLGLTADLVARHEGTLDVSDREPDGFCKAVVLTLPGQESADGTA